MSDAVASGAVGPSAASSTGPALVDLPDALLVPLLDAAVDVLRELEPGHVPTSLRPMVSWDRRGLARAAARARLLRAYADEADFRDAVVARFVRRPEAAVLADRFAAEPVARALPVVLGEAAGRGDDGLVASVLVAARPDGWEYGLGVVVGHHLRERAERAELDDRAADATRLRTVEEALRRAEAARAEAHEAMTRVDAELRSERRARRARDDDAELRVELARRRADELERAVAVERQRSERAVAESEDAEERARVATDEARRAARARDELADRLVATETALSRSAAPGIGLRYQDLQLLWESAVSAEALAQGLVALAHHAQAAAASAGLALTSTHQLPDAPADPDPEAEADLDLDGHGAPPDAAPGTGPRRAERAAPPAVPPPRRRRAVVPVPPGMVADSAEAVAGAMAAAPRLAVVVDGYNVAMRAWPDVPPAHQRERLGALVAQWQLRTRTAVTVVFDGADVVPGAGPSRRGGVRTLFSGPAEEADDVIVREVAGLPLDRPAIVASSDRELRRRVEAEGALPIGADVLLELVRR